MTLLVRGIQLRRFIYAWNLIADIFNALMAWPNLVGLIRHSGVVVRSTREYFADPARVYPYKVNRASD